MLNIKNTITSGQIFRFKEKDSCFTVCAGVGKNVKTLTISQDSVNTLEGNRFWSNFFDLETDYEAMKKDLMTISPVMAKACEFAPGIRIINQDPWEALCSFVVSQNNNIKRIMGIVDKMCTSFGEKNQEGVYGFPTPQALAGATEEELKKTGLGFRAPYIINTAQSVVSGELDFEELRTIDIDKARKILMNVKGIGPKVADCALLFGCHRLDCFPIDTWMKKIMQTYFPGQTGEIFGKYAGVAQQYLFHWARTGEEFK